MAKHYNFIPRHFLTVLCAVFLGSLPLTGQVSGLVISDQGEPLIGVNILVKGSNDGTITDVDGAFQVNADIGDTLVVTYIGFAQQEVRVNSATGLSIALRPETALLDEVVVVGYGTVKRSDLTGSVSSLTGDKLKKIPISSAAQALTGRIPGVNVLTTDGSPDAEVVIRVRGGGSITQDNAPLYVVDGFIVNSIRDIPPTDIESINVLKDAAATAIYGAQASNGVIVITTKEPVAGKISVSYNGFLQSKTFAEDRRYEVLSPYEFALANYEYAAIQSEAALDNFERYFGVYDDLELYQQKRPTDWQEELFGDPSLSQYHNLSLSGGSESTKISLSLTNNNDEGLLIGSGYLRNALNFKLDQMSRTNCNA
jgi:TonB-linked SusC/RagA family outer membrane protein